MSTPYTVAAVLKFMLTVSPHEIVIVSHVPRCLYEGKMEIQQCKLDIKTVSAQINKAMHK